jgi:hypothetical protein
VRTFRLLQLGLAASLLAWSGLLLAEGPGGVADDTGTSTPRHHAPRRKMRKKKSPKQTKRAQPDAGIPAVAPPTADVSATTSPDAGPDAASPSRAGTPRSAVADEDEDEDDDERGVSTDADSGTPRRVRRRGHDAGVDAGADAGPDQEQDEDDEDDRKDDEDDTAYELGVELAGESRLVWRGLAESRGAVLQSSGWAGFYGISLEGWGSYLLNAEGPFNPMAVVGGDLTASYAFSLGNLRFRPGLSLLYFPEGLSSSTTAEASLGVSYRFGDFRVVSGTNVDVSIEPGAYFGTLGLTWGRAKPPWTVKGLADVGWATGQYNHEYLGRDVAALDVVHAGVSARYDLGSVAYVELHVDVSGLVAPTLTGSVEEPVLLVGGAAVGLDWSVGR